MPQSRARRSAPTPSRGAAPKLMPAGRPAPMVSGSVPKVQGVLSGNKPTPSKARLRPGKMTPPKASVQNQGGPAQAATLGRDRAQTANRAGAISQQLGAQPGQPAAAYSGGALGPTSTADDQDPAG